MTIASQPGLVATEIELPPVRPTVGRVHVDVRVCTSQGRTLVPHNPPTLRLADAAAGEITTDVPLRRLRPIAEHEAAHFGNNIIVPSGDPILATITIAGQRAVVVLRQRS
jgi:hypothetical protein